MCNACIIEGVRKEAQSRRSFLTRSAAAGAAALAASVVSARQTLAQSSGKVVDLTLFNRIYVEHRLTDDRRVDDAGDDHGVGHRQRGREQVGRTEAPLRPSRSPSPGLSRTDPQHTAVSKPP